MRIDHGLDATLGIASRAEEVLFGIVYLILGQLQTRLGQLQLVIERILLGAAGFGVGGRELGDLRLLGSQIILGFLQASLNLLGVGAQDGRMLRRVEQRRGKGQVHFLIAKLQGSLREGLLFRGRRHLRQGLRGEERRLVDQRRLSGRSGRAATVTGAGDAARRAPGADQAVYRCAQEHRERENEKSCWLVSLLHCKARKADFSICRETEHC